MSLTEPADIFERWNVALTRATGELRHPQTSGLDKIFHQHRHLAIFSSYPSSKIDATPRSIIRAASDALAVSAQQEGQVIFRSRVTFLNLRNQ